MRYLLIPLIALLSACATKPISTMNASPVPENRIINQKFLQKSSDKGTLLVKRDSGFNTSACSVRIFVDSSPVADIRTSEKIYIHLPAGEYNIGARANGICAGGLVETRINLGVDKIESLRISYGSAGEFKISPTSF